MNYPIMSLEDIGQGADGEVGVGVGVQIVMKTPRPCCYHTMCDVWLSGIDKAYLFSGS